MIIYCENCRKTPEYFTLETTKKLEKDTVKFGLLLFEYTAITAHCKECKEYLYVPEVEKKNNELFQSELKKSQRKNVGFDFTNLKV